MNRKRWLTLLAGVGVLGAVVAFAWASRTPFYRAGVDPSGLFQAVWFRSNFVWEGEHGPDRDGDGIPELWVQYDHPRGIAWRNLILNQRFRPDFQQASARIVGSRDARTLQLWEAPAGEDLAIASTSPSLRHLHRWIDATDEAICMQNVSCAVADSNDEFEPHEFVLDGEAVHLHWKFGADEEEGRAVIAQLDFASGRSLEFPASPYRYGGRHDLLEDGFVAEYSGSDMIVHDLRTDERIHVPQPFLPPVEEGWNLASYVLGPDGKPHLLVTSYGGKIYRCARISVEEEPQVVEVFAVPCAPGQRRARGERLLTSVEGRVLSFDFYPKRTKDSQLGLDWAVEGHGVRSLEIDLRAWEWNEAMPQVYTVRADPVRDLDDDGVQDLVVTAHVVFHQDEGYLRFLFSGADGALIPWDRDA